VQKQNFARPTTGCIGYKKIRKLPVLSSSGVFYLINSPLFYAENSIKIELISSREELKSATAYTGCCTKNKQKGENMNYTTLAIGLFALLFGICTLFVRLKNPEKFGKLNAMKEKYGEKTGATIHTISYTVIPIVAGILFIIIGLAKAKGN